MKILILSCNTGNGHNSAAKAIYSYVKKHTEISCSLVDALEIAGKKASQKADSIYCGIVVKSPKTFSAIYKAGEFVSKFSFKSPVYFANAIYAEKLYTFIIKNGFDTIVCTHLFPMETITYIRKKYNPNIKAYGVFTDYCCTPFINETNLDKYFIPHKDIANDCVSQGMSFEKLIPTGIPVSENFNIHYDKTDARNRLGISPDNNVYLVMSGGMGFGNIVETCRCLLQNADEKSTVFVLTGKNTKLKNTIDNEFINDSRLISVPFTDEVHLYMSVSDVILTKPGGLSTSEAATAHIPIIHTMPIPGCETKNADFFCERGMSLRADSPKYAPSLACMLLKDKSLQEKIITAQKDNINENATKDIIHIIVGD